MTESVLVYCCIPRVVFKKPLLKGRKKQWEKTQVLKPTLSLWGGGKKKKSFEMIDFNLLIFQPYIV